MFFVYTIPFLLAFLTAFALGNALMTSRKVVCGFAWLIVFGGILIYIGPIFALDIFINVALLMVLGSIGGLVFGSLFKKG